MKRTIEKIIYAILSIASIAAIIWAFATGVISISAIIIGFLALLGIVVAVYLLIMWIDDNWDVLSTILVCIVICILLAIGGKMS